MKKVIFTIIIGFVLIGNVHAQTIEQQLNELKSNVDALDEKITSLENTRLNKVYPIGSIYITNTYSNASDVANAIGGTWEEYGKGRTLVGVNASDSNFNTVNKTGGASSITLSTSNLPSHNHSIPALSGTAQSAGVHNHNFSYNNSSAYDGWPFSGTSGDFINFHLGTATSGAKVSIASAGAHTHSVTTNANTSQNTGSGTAFTNLQPYITVYMYKRVA